MRRGPGGRSEDRAADATVLTDGNPILTVAALGARQQPCRSNTRETRPLRRKQCSVWALWTAVALRARRDAVGARMARLAWRSGHDGAVR